MEAYPDIKLTELNLVGNSPYDKGSYELLMMPTYIAGEVVGVDTILCTSTDCEIVPVVEVHTWHSKEYLAGGWVFLGGNRFLLYIAWLLGGPFAIVAAVKRIRDKG